MIRRTLAVFSSLFVALLLIGATSARASETLNVSATGVFLAQDGNQVTASISAYKSVTTDAQGNVLRSLIAGNVLLYGRLGSGTISLNVPVRTATYQNGWVHLTAPYTSNGQAGTLTLSLYARSAANKGMITGWVGFNSRSNGISTRDLFGLPGNDEPYVATFISSGVSILYRRF